MEEEIYDVLNSIPGSVPVEGINPRLRYLGRLTRNLVHEEETYVYFFGIPYAMPPTGDRRFQPPQQYKPEEDVCQASRVKPMCYQYSKSEEETGMGSEDCLYLNIYVPQIPKIIPKPLAVLVYFHGGGHSCGSGNYDTMTPDSLMNRKNIVFVTVNYRLGVFGFLNLRSEICKGNAGLKDQLMALQWIKKNISAFGGDPNNVTISGSSAGGSCVNFHLISPRSRGLFHKAIVQSGGIYCPWGYTGHHRDRLAPFKEFRNQPHYLRDAVVKELQSLKTEELGDVYKKFMDQERQSSKDDDMNIYLGPSSEIPSEDAFICCNRIEDLMMKQTQPVPILAGIVEKEGYMAINKYLKKGLNWIKSRDDFIRFLKVNLRWSVETATKNVDSLRNKYFPNIQRMNYDELLERFVDFCTDLWFYRFYDNFEFRDTSDPNKPSLFVYKFNYLTELNFLWSNQLKRVTHAAGHGDECCYLYPPFLVRKTSSLHPYRLDIQNRVDTMCSLWTSFCETGTPSSSNHPSFKWTPHTNANPCYLHIENDHFGMAKGRIFEERWNFMRETILAEPTLLSLPTTPLTPPTGCIVEPMGVFPAQELAEKLQEITRETSVASSTVTSTLLGSTPESLDQAEGTVGQEDRGLSEVPFAIPGPSVEQPSTLTLPPVHRPVPRETPEE